MISLGWICKFFLIGVCCLYSLKISLATSESAGQFEIVSAENGPPGVIWVVQLSDLHVSVNHPIRAHSLEKIMGKALSMIKPSLVIITGDLTDAKNKDHTITRQDEDEWVQYLKTMQIIMKESGLLANAFFDLRGNHDKFGVPYTGSQLDYFSKYSISADLNRTSPIQSVSVVANGGSKHLFTGVDFSMDVGLRGPCNLFGHPSDEVLLSMDLALGQWDNSPDPVTKIVFGHFPLSFTASSRTGKRPEDVFAKHGISAYICGHLHTKFGKHLYKHHEMRGFENGEFWEWEMGDWRSSRMMRLLAVDHGHTSFVDVSFRSYNTLNDTETLIVPTIILPTFPLDSRSMQRFNSHVGRSKFPDFHPMDDSIRALVFSQEHLVSVSAKIYDSVTGKMVLMDELLMHQDIGSISPLYIVQWDIKRFSDPSPTRFWLQVCSNNSLGEQAASELRPFSVIGKVGPMRQGIIYFIVMGIVWDLVYYPLLWGVFLLIFGVLVIPKMCSLYLERLGRRNTWGLELFACRTNNMSIFHRLIKTLLWILIEGSDNSCVWWLEVVYVVYLVLFPWFWGLVIMESNPPGYMSFKGWTVRSLQSAEESGLGVPDIIVVVLPFLCVILLPAILLNAALSAERSVREIHASVKFKCCKKREGSRYTSLSDNKDVESKKHAAFACGTNDSNTYLPSTRETFLDNSHSDTCDSVHRREVPSCKICRGWLRKLLLGGCLLMGLLHLRQCYFLFKAYGAKYILSSPGYVWPVPLLFLIGTYTTSSTKPNRNSDGAID
ncbi:hypothetical protein O6H91_18G025700 [Diphasiastrum complanatum]|uniref:Uncharacterized protein n=1 Tax=Diphasiastrum complanatum TaxID=34168 RepID=A0ACC2AZ41_DIPCM|nr:hypothetical protein O6H91_18G025700 [Diphasiastrum complanatum]